MSQSSFKREIMAAFRGGWNGNLNTLSFADAMYASIRRGFNQAWIEGAKECGILENERTQAEIDKLNLLIGDNFQYVGALAEWLYTHSKATGTKFNEVTYRADLWINRYTEIVGIAKTMACGNKKLVWRLGTSEHCRSCLKLSGRVARSFTWNEREIYPRMVNSKLKCGGYRCACFFQETDQPATRGRWPNLP